MTEKNTSPRHLARNRWLVMGLVSFGMFCGYFIADVASPLKTLFEQHLGWTSTEYGLYSSAYGWFNVFLGMLVVGGIVLDRLGTRLTGYIACLLMVSGAIIQWFGVRLDTLREVVLFEIRGQVHMSALGYALFGVGLEWLGITASKIIVWWFKGYEVALAMGLQVAIARLGTGLALGTSAFVASRTTVDTPLLLGAILAVLGLLCFLVYGQQDSKLERSEKVGEESEEKFRLSDIKDILKNKGFWYITILCALFYSAVFPFLKYAPDLMVQKFNISEEMSGLIPSLLPFGTILLTPIFGNIYDRKGRGATIMLIGSILVTVSHILFAIPILTMWPIAIFSVLLLGVGFSLVPSAMWPSVPRIIPERQLGTAYALIFFIQNLVALTIFPYAIGHVLDKYCIVNIEVIKEVTDGVTREMTKVQYDYMLPMAIFSISGIIAFVFAWRLKADDKKFGLEAPCRQM